MIWPRLILNECHIPNQRTEGNHAVKISKIDETVSYTLILPDTGILDEDIEKAFTNFEIGLNKLPR